MGRYSVLTWLLQILIKHRGTDEDLKVVERIVEPLNSRLVYMTYEEHDAVTANTQAVTHAAFLRWGHI